MPRVVTLSFLTFVFLFTSLGNVEAKKNSRSKSRHASSHHSKLEKSSSSKKLPKKKVSKKHRKKQFFSARDKKKSSSHKNKNLPHSLPAATAPHLSSKKQPSSSSKVKSLEIDHLQSVTSLNSKGQPQQDQNSSTTNLYSDRVEESEDEEGKNSESKIPTEYFLMGGLGSVNEVVVVQINLGRLFVLNEAATGYKIDNKIFLSLSEFVKTVEFSIELEDGAVGANGWFLDTKRLFALNLKEKLLLAGGVRYDANPSQIKVIDDDIFMDIDLMQKVFPVKLSFDNYTQSVQITSLEPLPIEYSIERDRRWEEFVTNKKKNEAVNKLEQDLTTLKSSYKLISSPIIDMRYVYNYKKSKVAGGDENTQFSTLFAGDLLYLNHQIFFGTNDNDLQNARVTSGRKDPQGELLGPLKATEFLLGDVVAPQNYLISNSQSGKGATITNYPEEYTSGFDQVLVRGNMQAGWDVELYRNDQLFNFQKVGADGIYEFQNVPLVSGLNIVRLVFYGPFGQKREEIRRFFTDQSLIKENKLYYRFAVNKHNQMLIDTTKSKEGELPDSRDGANRYFAELAYGVTKNTSLVADFIKIPQGSTEIGREDHGYSSIGIKTSQFGMYGDFSRVEDLLTNKNASQSSLQTKISDYSITAKNSKYSKNFVSELHAVSSDPIIDSSSIRLDGPFPFPYLHKYLTNSLFVTRDLFQSKQRRIDVQDEASLALGSKINIGQNFRFSEDSRQTGPQKVIKSGRTIVNYNVTEAATFRTTVAYSIRPKGGMTSASSNINYTLPNKVGVSLGHNYQFPQAGQAGVSNYTGNIGKSFSTILTTVGASYGRADKSYGVNLNLSTSIGYDLRYRTGVISSAPMAGGGMISAKVFLDENNNGVFDEWESPIKGVGMKVNGISSATKSNENGSFIVGQVSSSFAAKIRLNIEDLDDPFLIPKRPLIKMMVHGGSITNIEFPVIPVGEISGMVKILKEHKDTLATGAKIELVDENGNVVQETVSAYDGAVANLTFS